MSQFAFIADGAILDVILMSYLSGPD